VTDGRIPFPPSQAIVHRAEIAGLSLTEKAALQLRAHARAVLEANDLLHLTSITDPESFIERHLGEAFEGAALLPGALRGTLLDLGSGNGYPGIPVAVTCPGLTPVLVEASSKKAAFLREALRVAGLERGRVIDRRVDREQDLRDVDGVRVLVTRAMGGWDRIVPRLHAKIATDGWILVWAGGDAVAKMSGRRWDRFELVKTTRLPGRDQSSIHLLRPKPMFTLNN